MTTKHTPGPWKHGKTLGVINGADGSLVATTGYRVTAVPDGQECEDDANARLIAAAPEMLEALKAFIERGTKLAGFPASYDPWVGEIVAARAIIARAEGKEACPAA